MKKTLAFILTLIMVMGLNLTAFAENGGFVSSPSNTPAPEVVEATNETEECDADLIVTPYSLRDELPEELKEKIEKAYEEIVNITDVTELSEKIADIAKANNISTSDLAISELFNIHFDEEGSHSEHGSFSIVLKSSTLRKFLALMFFNGETWEIVENAEVAADGQHLKFDSNTMAPYAIVVKNDVDYNASPETNDASNVAIYVAIMLASALSLAVIWKKYSKSIAN